MDRFVERPYHLANKTINRPHTKVIVRNLPVTWTDDYLQNFLEVIISSLTVTKNGIHVFRGTNHTALISFEEQITGEEIEAANKTLASALFEGNTLEFELVAKTTKSLLVRHWYQDRSQARERLVQYFNKLSNGAVEDCNTQLYHPVRYAIVKFSSVTALDGALTQGEHKTDDGMLLGVEPWYKQFHARLLMELVRDKIETTAHKERLTEIKIKTDQINTLSTELERRNSESERQNSEIKRLKDEITNLKQKIEKINAAASEKQQKEHSETLQRHQREYERLKKQISELQNWKVDAIRVPAYKLRLLTDFADRWEGCKVMLLEQEEKAMFYGTEEDCEEGKVEFLKHLQGLADCSLPEPECVIRVLKTAEGKRYLDDLIRIYPKCSAQVNTSCVLCAATCEDELQAFMKELKRNIVKKVLQVPTSLTEAPEFRNEKTYWERNYLVRITLPSDDSEDVQIDGLNGDVELVAREIETFTSLNQRGSKRFFIPGKSEGQACKKWFLPKLDKTKHTIMKNGEIEEEGTTDQGYKLIFQCRQEVLGDVVDALNDIKYGIKSTIVDLNKEFTSYTDRALVVNGLNSIGTNSFYSQLAQKLESEGLNIIGDFVLPEEHALPECSFEQIQKAKRTYPATMRHQGKHRGYHRHSPPPPLPCTVTVGNTIITVKSGDITDEQADVIVSPMQSDLVMSKTAVGAAILQKYPHLAQALQEKDFDDSEKCAGSLISTLLNPTAQGTRSTACVKMVCHAVLSRTTNPSEVVKKLVTKGLNLAAQDGLTSIAFPPLGTGFRFKYDSYTVANTMISAILMFLLDKPDSLQNISVVLKEKIMADTFAKVLKFALGISTVTATVDTFTNPGDTPSAPEDDATTGTAGNGNASELGEQVPDFKETPTGRFEALFCTTQDQDCKRVIDILLKELRTTFLWHETVRDVETFKKVADHFYREIHKRSWKKNILFTLSDKGVRLYGQKDMVQQMLLMIRNKMYAYVVEQSKQGWKKRQSLGLPVDTDHLPRYWKVCENDQTVTYEKAIEIWKSGGIQTCPVTPDERAAVEQLVLATWDDQHVGHGKDAVNLSHTSVTVISVDRLENPEMWRAYSQRREQLFNSLVENHSGSSAACYTSVEDLKGSRGPVLTTLKIGKDGPLSLDIYPQLNEHYLFHGTKKEVLPKILSQGLDFRVAAGGMLGRGVYAAESSTKADQYGDDKRARRSGEQLKMLLMRVLLGEPFLSNRQTGCHYTRPPCMACSEAKCDCPDSRLYNSIVDDLRLFREFVVYDQNVCYPEYIITYKRV